MSTGQICPLKFWIRSGRPLDEIADALQHAGVIDAYSLDSENVYEWFTCVPSGYNVELNVSRKHYDGDLDFDEPLAFLVIGQGQETPPENLVTELAAAVHTVLQTPVWLGSIEYLGNDEFRYQAVRSLAT